VRSVLVCGLLLVACERTPVVDPSRDFATHEEVVAVGDGAGVFVTRAAGTLHAWTRAGKQVAAIDGAAVGDKADYERIAISAAGDLIADDFDQTLRVLEVPSGRVLWQREDTEPVWGGLAFVPGGSRLAVPLQGRVALIDARTGRDVATIDGDRVGPQFPSGEDLTLPREIWYSPDGAHVAIRCGRDQEMPANHTLYLADAATSSLRFAVYGQTGEIFTTTWAPDGHAVTLSADGMVRVIERGEVVRTLALAVGARDASRVAVSADLDTVVAAGEDLVVWRKGMAPVTIPRAKPAYQVVYLEVAGSSVLALSLHGDMNHYAIPPAAAASTDWVVLDGATRARDAALWAIGRGEQAAITGDDAIAVSARAYASGAPIHGPVSLDLIARWLGAGFVDPAYKLYAAWLASGAEDPRGISIGLALHEALETGDGPDLLPALFARWPNDPKIAELYAQSKRRD